MLKVDRRAWLALWAQGRRRRRQRQVLPVTLRTGLAGYWNLNESAGNHRADSSGQGWDLAEWSYPEAQGQGYRPVNAGAGLITTAADFGDSGGSEALVSFAPNTILNGDFTFACWINYNSTTGFDGQGLISLGGTLWIGIRAYTGAVNFGIKTNYGIGYSQVTTPSSVIPQNQWTQVVFVRDGGTLRIYVNGAERVNGPLTGTVVHAAINYFSGTDLILGINPWGYPMVGLVDEFGCWQRALSAAEVNQLYNNGNGLACALF